MATVAPIAAVGASGDQRLDGILAPARWSGPVSFGDPASAAGYGQGYPEELTDFERISPRQLAAARAALTDVSPSTPGHDAFSVAGFTLLDISYGGGASVIRLADTADPDTAYTYLPAPDSYGGDVFFGDGGRLPTTGNYDEYTVLHELGHALGLKHGSNASGFGALPASTDSMEYSVMTYASYVGSNGHAMYNENWGHAQTYMMYDIAALQYLYGANFAANAGNTTYSWSPGGGDTYVNGELALDPGANRIFETIWDGGGTDTYDLSNYAVDLHVDLEPGGYSTLAPGQRAYLGGGPNGGFARGSVFNALLYEDDPRSLIENAVGGAGDDYIAGNRASNALTGGAGDDRLYGKAGNDFLNGASGVDTLQGGGGNDTYRVDVEADVVVESAGGGSDTVQATGSYRLGANVETLLLVGGAASSGVGNTLANRVEGNAAANVLYGVAGNDILRGGGGADVLVGGSGADTFRFATAGELTAAAPDVIRVGIGTPAFDGAGPAAGDHFDLAGIDADAAVAGVQHFILGASHTVSHLWIADVAGDTVVSGNVAGGTAPEFQFVVEDGAVLASDYTAADFTGLA